MTREEKVAAFQVWLKDHNACAGGRRFARGKTAREAWLACHTPAHQEFMHWFVNKAGFRYYWRCYCPPCLPGGPNAVRMKVKLPRVLPWERKAKKA